MAIKLTPAEAQAVGKVLGMGAIIGAFRMAGKRNEAKAEGMRREFSLREHKMALDAQARQTELAKARARTDDMMRMHMMERGIYGVDPMGPAAVMSAARRYPMSGKLL